jgi:hypothetical protein
VALAFSLACSKTTVAPVTGPRDLNIPPVARLQVSAPCEAIAVTLDASASSDADGDIRLYEWDLDNNGTIDTSGAALRVVQHTYAVGNHRVKLVVTDNSGAFNAAASAFTVAPTETTYVSSSTGSPAGPGTRNSPFTTLSAALALGAPASCARVILVATGFYPEAPYLTSNTVIRGGYNPVDWSHRPGVQTDIGGSPTTASSTQNTTVYDIRFLADDITYIPAASAIAFVAVSCDASLHFVHCAFVAGDAGFGTNGESGVGNQGGPGEAGQDGFLGGRGGGAIVCCRTAANAGGGGGSRNNDGGNGRSVCALAGAGGVAGTSNSVNGTNGLDGGSGGAGTNGSGGTSIGVFSGATWLPATSPGGQDGCGGGGGGGGGGGWTLGGCPTDWSGTGGGGGQGGVGGSPGAGGRGGGASVALLLIDSSPRFDDCSFVSGTGGPGGTGGSGRDGGPGAAGGRGATSSCGSSGGNGGHGGPSGPGGGGQGGPGGPSWCIVKLGTSTPALVNASFTVGTGGTGGLGGTQGSSGPLASSGPNGPASEFGP